MLQYQYAFLHNPLILRSSFHFTISSLFIFIPSLYTYFIMCSLVPRLHLLDSTRRMHSPDSTNSRHTLRRPPSPDPGLALNPSSSFKDLNEGTLLTKCCSLAS